MTTRRRRQVVLAILPLVIEADDAASMQDALRTAREDVGYECGSMGQVTYHIKAHKLIIPKNYLVRLARQGRK